jgi:hypothetical protein
MGEIDVTYTPKSLLLVIEAMEERLKWCDSRIPESDDEVLRADMVNDRALVGCILDKLRMSMENSRREIEKSIQEWKAKHE